MDIIPKQVQNPRKRLLKCSKAYKSEGRRPSYKFLREKIDIVKHGSRVGSVEKTGSSRVDFFHAFRNVRKIEEACKYHKVFMGPTSTYLKHCEKQKLNPLPFSLFESDSGHAKNILTDRYVKPYAKGLNLTESLMRFNVKDSRLKPNSSCVVIRSLKTNMLVEINLSGNFVGLDGAQQISKILLEGNCQLGILVLENCSLSEKSISTLSLALESNTSVFSLNLAKNNLKSNSGIPLGSMLLYNHKLKELDLHWNNICQEGAAALFDGLEKNDFLFQLDLSWNCLGTNSSIMLPTFSKCLLNNTELKHLDISFNSLKNSDCEAIGSALEENHTILGLHTLGNAGFCDAYGYIHTSDEPVVNLGGFSRILEDDHIREGENCWLCERWVEAYITLPTGFKRTGPLYAHLDIDDYLPNVMELSGSKFRLTRVLPERKLRIFFSDSSGIVFLSINMLQEGLKEPLEVATFEHNLKVFSVNVLEPAGFECEMGFEFVTKPRDKSKFVKPKEPPPKMPWCIENSIFNECIMETPGLLDKCFEFDWNQSRIPSLISSEEDLVKCKELLRNWYPAIKNTYKALSVFSTGEIFSINSNTFHEFLVNSKVFDGLYGISDFGVNWSATLTRSTEKHAYNPTNCLVRHEFLEILVRIARDKYSENSTMIQAVEKFMGLISNFFINQDPEIWREKYYCEEVDCVLKANEYLLHIIYNLFSAKKGFPRHREHMSLEGFKDLCCKLGFPKSRNIELAYINGMFLYVNEIDKKLHMEMTKLEFYEAIMRALDANIQNGTLAEKFIEAVPLFNNIVSFSKKKSLRQNISPRRKNIPRKSTLGP